MKKLLILTLMLVSAGAASANLGRNGKQCSKNGYMLAMSGALPGQQATCINGHWVLGY